MAADGVVDESNCDENIGLGCALEMFSELQEVINMIENLRTIYSSEISVERAYERFTYIMNQYQEQPHLLDPHLDNILDKLICIVRCRDASIELKHATFKYLYVIMKVRGYKVVVRHLPHEVSDIEPVLQLLEIQNPSDNATWQTRYVLLLWLSIIVMIPFHMSRLDSFKPEDLGNERRKTVMERILSACKIYALSSDLFLVAAFLSSRFLARPHVKELHLAAFLDWACNWIVSSDSPVFAQCGSLAAVSSILKHGKREDLLPHSQSLLKWILASKYRQNSGTNITFFMYKASGPQCGLIFLKMRVAVWRYQRGGRSLAANLSAGDGVAPEPSPLNSVLQNEEELDEDFEIPDGIEEVIEELVQGLRDSDTVIRWSAAKGIGRVTGRLPKELADDVVGSVLELFNIRESDGAWHGGCLALAELGRRGLLLPQRLVEVVPVILKALVYDEPRGYASVGTHIRDAACYVCWAFARAYDTTVLQPFVKDIAAALLVTAVFDREINCRRAASAAFQENVGRQGTFPHGIDILTTADYFTVSVRSNAFLNIRYTLQELETCIFNIFCELKYLLQMFVGQALHNLTPKAPTFTTETVLRALLDKTSSIDLNARHGAVLGIAEILHALAVMAKQSDRTIQDVVGPRIVDEVRNLVPTFGQRQQFRGLGGELMKQACSFLIEKCSMAVMPFHNHQVIEDWQTLLDECLSHEVGNIRSQAALALSALFTEYYQLRSEPGEHYQRAKCNKVIATYTRQLAANNQITRMGYSLAIGSFPKFMFDEQLDIVIVALIQCSKITETTGKWAESRRDALKAVTSICLTVSSSEDLEPVLTSHLDHLYDCFLDGLTEYTMDSRGDIGAWVREASVTGLQVLTGLVVKSNSSLLTSELVTKVMVGVAQQAVERIDRTRAHAGKIFRNLLHSDPAIPNIPHHAELVKIFPPASREHEINWIAASDTFPRFIQLLAFRPFTYNVLLGLVVSVGGLTESVVKHSSSSLFSYLKAHHSNSLELERLCKTIIEIFRHHQYVDRITIPLFEFLDRLFSSGCVCSVLENPRSTFASDVLNHTKLEIGKTREVTKLRGSVNVLCHLVQVNGEVSRRSLVQLCIFLCNRFLWVRKTTASRLYEALLLYGEDSVIPGENLDEVMAILSDTDWEQDVDIVKPTRNKLCNLMGVPVPKTVSVAAARKKEPRISQ
ncbi:tubulin-specific chaperone D [Zootermopsis nevadensis]|uniref:tubulin-specific chaperone D n=1 Tax=Zootermopsis nevadensis TaxID=136037 RepID=UPI000B8ECA22|nr:tubulin-specific chaperone D [Zootermopsis nevadensis]